MRSIAKLRNYWRLTVNPSFGIVIGVNRTASRLVAVFSFIGQLAGWAAGLTPDFRLMDVNPNSERYTAPVSPRDYILQVSGYYFGNAG